MSYLFSCFIKRPQARLVRRPWWNLWGRDSITYVEVWERIHIRDLSGDETSVLLEAGEEAWGSPWARLFIKALGNNPQHFQVETVGDPTQYVATSQNMQ